MRAFLMGGLLALAVGCGGPMEQEEESVDLSSQEAPLPNCTNMPTSVTRYYNSSLTKVVGERGCACGSYISWGTTTVYHNTRNSC